MKNCILLTIFLFFFVSCNKTRLTETIELTCEKSHFRETPRYNQTIAECKKLCSAVSWLKYTTFGQSPQHLDLPLIIADIDRNFTPAQVHRSRKIVILIQACIHPGEPEGKDAGLIFLRNLAENDSLQQWLEKVTILFIPIFNVDGHERFGAFNRINQNGPEEMGWRTTAANFNLNRDFLKAETPEMQSWLKLYNQWLPHILIDCHTTDGADYQYPLTYSLELHGNLDAGLTQWCKNILLPGLENNMNQHHMPVIPYTIFRNWHDPRSGLITWVTSPAYSTGYTTVQNRIGLLIETHMLKDYKTRVEATLHAIESVVQIAAKDDATLDSLTMNADIAAASDNFLKNPFTLTYKLENDSIAIQFKGKKYLIVKSDLTGGDWFQYSDTNQDFTTWYFNKMSPDYSAKLPLAYLVPVEYASLVEAKLRIHGVEYKILDKTTEIKVKSYRFSNVRFSMQPVEGRQKIVAFDMDTVTEKRIYTEGSLYIPVAQRRSRIVIHLFEPKAPDSFLAWGFLNAVFEQKEYGETYVMEKLARQMLAGDTALASQFEKNIKNNPRYKGNQWEMLNWFYNHSPFRDQKMNIYPFGLLEK